MQFPAYVNHFFAFPFTGTRGRCKGLIAKLEPKLGELALVKNRWQRGSSLLVIFSDLFVREKLKNYLQESSKSPFAKTLILLLQQLLSRKLFLCPSEELKDRSVLAAITSQKRQLEGSPDFELRL